MTPFDPQPLTPVQQQQVADKKSADELIAKILTAIAKNSDDEDAAYAKWASLVRLGQTPGISNQELDINALVAASAEYHRLLDLQRELYVYLGAIAGWRGGVGQHDHPTFERELEIAASVSPNAAAVVNPKE